MSATKDKIQQIITGNRLNRVVSIYDLFKNNFKDIL